MPAGSFTFFDNQYSAIGAACALIYALGNGRRLLGAEYGRKADLRVARLSGNLLHRRPIVVAPAADRLAFQFVELREQATRFRH